MDITDLKHLAEVSVPNREIEVFVAGRQGVRTALRRALSCPPVRLAACRLGAARRPVGFALIGLPRLGTGNGSSQAVKHVPHAMQKILDHEG
jgi:hypothetical protein